jgi:transposase
MPTLRKYPPELKDRAVRLVLAAHDSSRGLTCGALRLRSRGVPAAGTRGRLCA